LIGVFKDSLKEYETARGTIRFPLDKPLPLDLVREMVKVRVQENLSKTAKTKKKK
jgi:uncharacterized protein YdhG (YjbR/CyaY superfamily)